MVLLFLIYFLIITILVLIGTHQKILDYVGKYLCKHGRHKFKKKKYYCVRCKMPRDWPILKCVNGHGTGKLNFPEI